MKRRLFGIGHTIAVCVSVVLAGTLIAGTVGWGFERMAGEIRVAAQTKAGGAPVAPAPMLPAVSFGDVSLENVPYIGVANAPAGMAYWFDYQCPFCKRVEQEVMPRLIEEYVKPGKLRIYFKDFQFLGQDSFDAAIISRAVWEVAPNLFGAWHSALFARQDRENAGWGSKPDLLALLDTIDGLDAARVRQLVEQKSSEYVSSMDSDLSEAGRFGIQGTPGTVIGTQLLSGARPYEEFKAAVETVLKGGGGA
jgi:protein-disulfide isomerase